MKAAPVRLSAPTPAARPRQEDPPPGGCGPPRLLSTRRSDFAAGLGPGTALPGNPGSRREPGHPQGHPESVKYRPPPSPAFLFSRLRLRARLPFPARSQRRGRGVPRTPSEVRAPGRAPGPPTVPCAPRSHGRTAQNPSPAKESWLGRHLLVGPGLSLLIG